MQESFVNQKEFTPEYVVNTISSLFGIKIKFLKTDDGIKFLYKKKHVLLTEMELIEYDRQTHNTIICLDQSLDFPIRVAKALGIENS